MKRLICFIICALTVLSTAALFPSDAASGLGRIYPFVPVVEDYYPGLEEYIAKALREKKTSIDVSDFHISKDNIIFAYKSAVFDNPDIFYVDASFINYNYNNLTDLVETIRPRYICELGSIPSMVKKFNKAVDSFLDGVSASWSGLQKALVLHDRIAVNCEYKEKNKLSFTAYGALVSGQAICEGYSRAYSLLLSKVGVNSKIINNDVKHHCWNAVEIEGRFYHIDVTSDDPKPDTCGYVRHKFFLCTDSKLLNASSGNYTGFMSDVTFSDAFSCSSLKYNTAFFRNICSEIVYYKKAFYYIDNNYKGKHRSALIRLKNGKKKALKVIPDVWYYANKYPYKDSFSKLCASGKYIFFNTKRDIYRYSISSKKFKRVLTIKKSTAKSFYGIALSGRYIYTTRYNSRMKNKSMTKVLKITSSGKAKILSKKNYK
ncbi:MAG: hypothetical protein IIU14_01075 [Ruminococcus sp.]|nr:hypothetical protein [Ruminococcus sp.]